MYSHSVSHLKRLISMNKFELPDAFQEVIDLKRKIRTTAGVQQNIVFVVRI